jgi:hypothetical protein
MKIFLLILLTSFFSGIVCSQPTNEAVSTGTVFDGEPYLAMNPTNPENMVIAWMSYDPASSAPILSRFSIRLRSSFDGGKTWGNEVLMAHSSKNFHSADVSMAFHSDGTLYIDYIDYQESPDSGGIFVARSTDGGRSWSNPVKAFDGYDNNDKPIDRPWMVVDNSGTASDGMLYITTKSVFWDPLPNHPYIKTSSDGGKTWSPIANVDGGNYTSDLLAQPMATPAVTASGILNIVYPSWPKVTSPVQFILARSTDKGASFSRSVIYTPVAGSGGDTLSKLGYHLTCDPTNANNLLVAGIDKRNGDGDVYAFFSSDRGTNWTSGTRINDDPIGNGVWQDLVWANYAENGKCVISWRDRRNGDSSGYEQGSDIYFAVSTDHGKTFGKNIRLSDSTAAWTKVLDAAGNDFHSTAIIHDSICAAWGDTRTGKLVIYFAKAALADGIANVVAVSGNENNFSMYPNPASGSVVISLKLNKPDAAELFIYDISGKQVAHYSSPTTNTFFQSVDLTQLSEGIYTVAIKTSRENYSQKLVVKY